MDVAWAYYFFSIQFRENLLVARLLWPADQRLKKLEAEECNTANLSPWPGVTARGERVNHDEFMRRLLTITPIQGQRIARLNVHGKKYLDAVHDADCLTRAQSIVSYEGGGLEQVFRAMLEAPDWCDPLLKAFQHFVRRHLQLDSSHGGLVSHLQCEHDSASLWLLFKDLLVSCVPQLEQVPSHA